MPNGYSVPFGNIFEVKTPAIDRLGERIYQEERQRELYRQQQSRMLDDEFARNMSGIRDSDIGELTKAYGDYKLSHQQLMKKRDGASPEEQLGVLRKKAAIYDILNKSKVEKAQEDNWAKMIPNDKRRIFADDAAEQLRLRRQKPLSQLNPEEDKKLLYPYSVPDLAKEIKTAEGEVKDVPITLGVSKTDPLKDDKEIYKVKNNPSVFAGKLLEQIVSGNKGRNFSGMMNNKYDDQELEDLTNKYYAKINDPKFVAIYGKVDPLPNTDTQLGKAVAIRTMEEYANLDLKPTKLVSELNQDRVKDRALKEWQEKNKITYGQALSKIRLNASLQGKGGNNYTVGDLITEDGNTDLTKPLQGINVNNVVTGKAFKSDKTIYNPRTKEITFHDVVDDKDYTVPASKFRQIINTINTVQDLKVFDNLIEGIDKAYAPPKTSTQKNRPPLTDFIKHK